MERPGPVMPREGLPRWHDAYPGPDNPVRERDSLADFIASFDDPYTDEQKEAMRAAGGWQHNPFTDVED